LVEVLRRIEANLQDKGMGALVGSQLKEAAMKRVFGFEILTAPFVVAHLQLGLMLQNLGVPLNDEQERVGVYLTNALTGWEPPKETKQALLFPELEEERDASENVKQAKPILVVLGNPPYDGFAGMAIGEERDLSNAYRTTKKAPKPQGQGLNELYVRFFRMAERRIVEQTGQGIICYISNYSWLDGLSHPGMRERYIECFDSIWIDNLHGDRIISEYAPDGRTSETVFAMQGTSVGIKIGTAISLLVAKKSLDQRKILYRDVDQARASERRKALICSLESSDFGSHYTQISPAIALGLPLKPKKFDIEYPNYPLLSEILPISYPGIQPCRDELLIDVDKATLVARIQNYFDRSISHSEMGEISPVSMKNTQRFNAISVREYLQKRGFLPDNIIGYYYRPFDRRWLYWEPETKLLDEKRAEYFPHVVKENFWVSGSQRRSKSFDPPFISSIHCSRHIADGGANLFPVKLRPQERKEVQQSLLPQVEVKEIKALGFDYNLSEIVVDYLSCLGLTEYADCIFHHIVAILYSSMYATENAGALKQDFPRIPLPDRRETLIASATLGRQIAALLDPETHVLGVTSGKLRPELKKIAVVSRIGTGNLDPNTDFALTAGWGHAGQNSVTMPGRGKVSDRAYTPEEQTEIAAVLEQLGTATHDIYLNDIAYWKNIPDRVWSYTIGGYQVIKKWLSYREQELLGRSLKQEEVMEVTQMARRITAILLLEPELDANYEAVKQATYPWPAQK
jgi:hypothetical protein